MAKKPDTDNVFKAYVVSQRLKYLGLGIAIGYIFCLIQKPYNLIIAVAFILFALILSRFFLSKCYKK